MFFSSAGLVLPAHGDEKKLEYNRDIRPILSDACFACHGPDSASRKGGLRLDQRDAAIEMSAIDPGHPELSELITRILSSDPEQVMPPPETKKTLTAEQKDILSRWVKEGAEYQLHWSFIPPTKPVPPTVKHTEQVRNPIDQFVLARLEEANLTMEPEADRRTLARRVSLDLTGLPPTPEVVEAFVQDQSPNAYELLVDKLLESAAWGEHRGRYWLDYARYADTHGIHFDNYREMWSYRDWVIDAFNQNMPFSQFTIENLAGDLLPDATLDQKIASGFNRCNMTTNEGGLIDEEYLVLYTRDRTDTTAQVWLGLTAGCAVCHSHKFDPLSQKEFYELAAFFNNTTQSARDGNIKDTPPVMVVPRDEERDRWVTANAEVVVARADVEKRRAEARAEFDVWVAGASPEYFEKEIPVLDLVFQAALNQQGSFTNVSVNDELREVAVSPDTQWVDGKLGSQAPQVSKVGITTLPDVGDFQADQPFTCSAWIKAPAVDISGAIVARMDPVNGHRGWDLWIENRRVGTHLIDRWSDNALKVVSTEQIPADTWVHVAFTYQGNRSADGVEIYINGQLQKKNPANNNLKGDIRTDVPFYVGQRHNASAPSGVAINDVRIYNRALNAREALALAKFVVLASTLRKPVDQRTPDELNDLFNWWLTTEDKQFQNATARVTELEKEVTAIKSRGTIAHVMQEKSEEAVAYILNRGEYDQRLDQVKPATPEVLPPFPDHLPRNRLGFAQWLILPEQPLTSRVTVNRFWQEVFGVGLVKTSGDFGVMGEIPENQELLDWLAVDFVESGWDVKRLFKLIVMSGAYRQSAVITAQKREIDPDNRMISRGPRFRMDAEMVRDYALAASGELTQMIGGPSLKPYQPGGIWDVVGMPGSTTRDYVRDKGPDLYRRSLYTFVKRMAPPVSLEIFNAPNREFCVVRRERTNTPLQALVTLNDEQFVEAARTMAQRAILRHKEPAARLSDISNHLLCREFQPKESEVVLASLEGLKTYYDAHPEDAKLVIQVGESKPDESIPPQELAAWTMLCNELMNLDEVLNK
ncbi:DUF1553 domain-containing protein [Planctomicrobium sp. SH661]|uniref:DUF1553 domain-containing protein n=1 Tax=Planctomicrobium sp. SH661 TaxID=3448124 RepID=UPI003F5C1C24